jgi:hypothetical protein
MSKQPMINNQFLERPILNSSYEYPSRHWELDEHGKPTQRINESPRRKAEFITRIPKPRKRKERATQSELDFALRKCELPRNSRTIRLRPSSTSSASVWTNGDALQEVRIHEQLNVRLLAAAAGIV